MRTYRFPVLVWRDHGGMYTAKAAADEPELAGIGHTRAAALAQLDEYLKWRYAKAPWYPGPDFHDPKLATIKVSVRPEYRSQERVFPSDEQVLLPVHCLYGRQESGLLIAALPLLDICFYYYEAAALEGLVVRYVQQRLQGLSPSALARFLPPQKVELESLVVRVRVPARERAETPTLAVLESVAEALGERAVRRQFQKAWQREREAAELAERLRRTPAHLLVVGPPGVGKTTLLVEAVRAVERQPVAESESRADEQAPPVRRRFWQTSAARLIAGMQYLGQWEERLEAVIAELASIRGVLCLENLLDLVRAGGREPLASVAAFLMPYLARGELRVVAEATPEELDACRRLLPGLADLFQIVLVAPFDRASALAVLERCGALLSQQHKLAIETGVCELVYRYFHRFLPYQAFPGKVVAFLGDLAEQCQQAGRASVRPDDATALFVRRTGLPELMLRDERPLQLSDVAAAFQQQVIGQPEACRAAANVVVTFKAGMNDPRRPLGVLLFCGPTGVGKTELARAISTYLFGHGADARRLVRLDMSEYGGPGAAQRLLGPPGGEPGELVRRVRAQPFSVVLFDEIEKAAPEVFDVLLGVFDEGRLTDLYGRTTSFHSTILIMTSNLGASAQEPLGFARQGGPSYEAEAQAFFRLEFFNRIDAVVTFDPLDAQAMEAITRKELAGIAAREGLAKAGLRLSWSDRLVSHLARAGCDQRYGARPLLRTLERLVVAPLARWLLAHPGARGGELALELAQDQSLAIRHAPAAP